MVAPHLICLVILLSAPLQPHVCTAAYRYVLKHNDSINDGESLVSRNQRFELGFFNPSSSTDNKSYLGIWYKDFPDVIAWVANRENPLVDSPGTLSISPNGKLVILNSANNVIWSSSSYSSSTTSRNYSLQLLDTGNLVLTRNAEASTALWQSFDYPGDTLLPGMKMGWDWKTGQSWNLTSWKDENDPSPGEFRYSMDVVGLPQLVLRQAPDKKLFRTGIWNGVRFSSIFIPEPSNPVFNYIYNNNSNSVSFSYNFTNNPVFTRLKLNQSGILQRYVTNMESSKWDLAYSTPFDFCSTYEVCGANTICKIEFPNCECLHGFVPASASETEFNYVNKSMRTRCVRRRPLDCAKGEGFLEVKNVNMPDLLVNQFWLDESKSLEECETECLRNCSCTAYANSDVRGRGSGCLIWFGDLIDVVEIPNPEKLKQNLYIRVAVSELVSVNDNNKRTLAIIAVMSTVSGVLLLFFVVWWRIRTLKRSRERNNKDMDLPLFDLATITSATDNFSNTNMIGAGGFGSVYKGKLSTGQEIAVKRLSQDSGQGVQEFKNEIILISKLQHRNLVRIIGCCPEGKEKLLVYEYLPNKSLDYFIFEQKRSMLKWQNRYAIAMGIAKGLAYLHHDSRLTIIHRDLKASNILLDNDMTPKISDFGIARIFGGDQHEGRTKIVIGTYGYMSPEYVIDGKFSTKSDVFSYGVLLLEIVTGKRITHFNDPEHYHGLAGHAWALWKDGKALEIMDECLMDSYVASEVEKCVQISLLCVQRLPKDRPTMTSIVAMLGNEVLALAQPKQPGFFVERRIVQTEAASRQGTIANQLTVTCPEPR